eukprot:CAMPEP_0171299410 /NCGR_PEP_ID=MMETSP0816-20121228/8230_1 /TAXON_ID=420281 /ORGANISM="Proboscia inermis, Strain CCAP1064/1" /LENGTH=114 /DNA_ID=CAMNT_0011775185 /DNA_START=55 /DNA_END=399 /DNA_ORIENTATION=+
MIFNLRQCAIATFMLLAAVTEAADNPTLAPSDPPTFKPTNRPTFKDVEITIQKGKGKGGRPTISRPGKGSPTRPGQGKGNPTRGNLSSYQRSQVFNSVRGKGGKGNTRYGGPRT